MYFIFNRNIITQEENSKGKVLMNKDVSENNKDLKSLFGAPDRNCPHGMKRDKAGRCRPIVVFPVNTNISTTMRPVINIYTSQSPVMSITSNTFSSANSNNDNNNNHKNNYTYSKPESNIQQFQQFKKLLT